jgi:hypothetical protein
MRAWNGRTWKAPTILKTLSSVQTYVYKTPSFGKKGTKANPSIVWLIRQADYGGSGAINNYPDKTDPHGADGEPILFADGHTEFVKVGNYIRGRDFSQDWNHGQ